MTPPDEEDAGEDPSAAAHEMRDWVEVRRFGSDGASAAMTRDFLRGDGLRAATYGVATVRLAWSETSDVARVVVHPDDVERARESLAALDAELGEAAPFRGSAPPPSAEAPLARRHAYAAIGCAVLFPFGGGHFYARHRAAGVGFAAGVIGTAIAAQRDLDVRAAEVFVLLVVADAIGAIFAVRRFNAGAVSRESTQWLVALSVVALAFVYGWLRGMG